MCTSLTFNATNQHHYLARTMDFAFELDAVPVVIPRNYQLNFELAPAIKTTYGFVGSGKKLTEYMVADGVNEKGLAMAELYFLHEAVYSATPVSDKLNLAPQELIMWILGNIASIAELRAKLETLNLVQRALPMLNTVVPLHYIVTDSQGETVVLETNTGRLQIKENPVGVMTNSPELEWHLKNLTNYLALKPTNVSNRTIGNYELKPFGQGSGTFGLPGGYTSPERFVKTVYQRYLAPKEGTPQENVNTIFRILDGVTIPKGVNLKEDGSEDYTQYRAVFDVTDRVYYMNPYTNQSVYSVALTDELLNASEPIEFTLNKAFTAQVLNSDRD